MEGGIDLTARTRGSERDLPCINRFLANTGSSHPDTGVLKDFAGGEFNLCSKLIVDKVAPEARRRSTSTSRVSAGARGASCRSHSRTRPPQGHGSDRARGLHRHGDGSRRWVSPPTISCKDQANNRGEHERHGDGRAWPDRDVCVHQREADGEDRAGQRPWSRTRMVGAVRSVHQAGREWCRWRGRLGAERGRRDDPVADAVKPTRRDRGSRSWNVAVGLHGDGPGLRRHTNGNAPVA